VQRGCAAARSADEGKIPDFSRRNREFHRFAPRNRHLATKNGEANQAIAREFP